MNGRHLVPLSSLLIVALVAGCADHPPAAVHDLSRSLPQTKVLRIVRPGDTLYAIAWAAGVDYRQLARWNGLQEPYIIRPGQTLTLIEDRSRPLPKPQAKTTAIARPSKQDSIQRQPLKTNSVAATKAPANAGKKPEKTKPVKQSAPSKPSAWSWPVKGKVVRKFSVAGSKGIDIAVNGGTPVKAASAGEVVYAGSGLRGYGQLIILKHSEEFLSAYGHNRKLLVAEGDRIQRGQVIAESGHASGGGAGQLHFEIRRNGKPVNPLQFLGG